MNRSSTACLSAGPIPVEMMHVPASAAVVPATAGAGRRGVGRLAASVLAMMRSFVSWHRPSAIRAAAGMRAAAGPADVVPGIELAVAMPPSQ